jgi:hypothetical protein
VLEVSKLKAVSSRSGNYTERQLKEKAARIKEKIKAYLEELDKRDADKNAGSAVETGQMITEMRKSKEREEGYADRGEAEITDGQREPVDVVKWKDGGMLQRADGGGCEKQADSGV